MGGGQVSCWEKSERILVYGQGEELDRSLSNILGQQGLSQNLAFQNVTIYDQIVLLLSELTQKLWL